MRAMNQIANMLWDAFRGALLAAGFVRLAIALGGSAQSDLATAQTEQAGFFSAALYVTHDQFVLMNVMAATVLFVGAAWAIAHGLSLSRARARD